jgi:quercetin dioxygenase-like cupin family protein
MGVTFLDEFDPAYRHPDVASPGEVVVSRDGEGDAHRAAGDTYTVRLDSAATGGKLNVVDFLIPPGCGPQPHEHARDAEIFVVLEGEVTLYDGGRNATVTGRPGDIAVLPPGIPHGFRNNGETPAKLLCLTAPGGFAELVRAVDGAAPEQVPTIVAKHGVAFRMDLSF